MDHLLAADVLLGEQAALAIHGSGSYSNIVAHVFFFANLVVDKLWHGKEGKVFLVIYVVVCLTIMRIKY